MKGRRHTPDQIIAKLSGTKRPVLTLSSHSSISRRLALAAVLVQLPRGRLPSKVEFAVGYLDSNGDDGGANSVRRSVLPILANPCRSLS